MQVTPPRAISELLDELAVLEVRYTAGELDLEPFSRIKLGLLAELQRAMGRLPSVEDLLRVAEDER